MNAVRNVVAVAGICFVSVVYGAAQNEPLPDSPGAQVAVAPQPTGPTAVIDTTMGRISCKLFQKEAPIAVKNFIDLSEGTRTWTDPTTRKPMKNKPLYDGTIFHRVIPDFMIQGGDPTGTGTGDPGYYFEDEFVDGLGFDVPGRLAMANSGPATNGSQFFITTAPTPHLNHHHTIFGQCDDAGLAVARAIAAVPRNGSDKPDVDIRILHISIVADGKPLPALMKGEPAATPVDKPVPSPAMPTAPAEKAASPASAPGN
jgi:peptidyl-prolyl cis-trans isomerase A (cyclophilin A)